MKAFLAVAALLASSQSVHAQQTVEMNGLSYHRDAHGHYQDGCEWPFSSLGWCNAAEIAQQAEWDRQTATREAQAKQDKLDPDFHTIELSCRVSSVTYFQYTGCVEMMVEAYKSSH